MALKKLFSPLSVKGVLLRNRIVCSPCDLCASMDGIPSEQYLDHIVDMARGECGLIIPGALGLSAAGITHPLQSGVFEAKQVNAWRDTISKVDGLGSKIVFQVVHGAARAAQSVNVGSMRDGEIDRVIADYAAAAVRLEMVGAAGIQLHAAHGCFFSALLSLFPAKGTDVLAAAVAACKQVTAPGFLVGVKVNGDDCVPGMATPSVIGRALQVAAPDFAEVSLGGGPARSHWNVDRILPKLSGPLKLAAEGLRNLPRPTEGYTFEAARLIKSMNPGTPVAAVGGWKSAAAMEEALKVIDLVSLGRPFIREPQLAKHLREGASEVECARCGQCMLLYREVTPVRCFLKEGFLK